MPQAGIWKDWLVKPLQSLFTQSGAEPLQARPPPPVPEQFRREVTRLPVPATVDHNDPYRPLTPEECVMLGLPADYVENFQPYKFSEDGCIQFLDWEEIGGKRLAVFRVENEDNPMGYHFSRLRYGEVQFAGKLGAIIGRPDADLQALQVFHERFGKPTKADLEEAEAFFFEQPQKAEL